MRGQLAAPSDSRMGVTCNSLTGGSRDVTLRNHCGQPRASTPSFLPLRVANRLSHERPRLERYGSGVEVARFLWLATTAFAKHRR